MVYFADDSWLASDPIDSVKPSSVVRLDWHEEPEELAARGVDRTYVTCHVEIGLTPAA